MQPSSQCSAMKNLPLLRMAPVSASITLISLSLLHFNLGAYSATFTVVNKCSYTVWPGILSGSGTPELDTSGFALQPGESRTLPVPTSWSGRLWGRTHCSQDANGTFSCVTGDCGSSNMECAGRGAAPPATLAEFTLNGADGLDFYDVSLVDGYNLPMAIVPQGATGGNCNTTGCAADLNSPCPSELKVTSEGDESVACKSACGAFGDPQYCCSGAYASPASCKPSSFSEFFKDACPLAYSYAFDDGTSTFTCAAGGYVISFCPRPSNSVKSTTRPDPLAADVSAAGRDSSASVVAVVAVVAGILAMPRR